MRKVLTCLFGSKSQKTKKILVESLAVSMLFACLFSLARFFMERNEYENSILPDLAYYFSLPIFTFFVFAAFSFPPYMWFIATNYEEKDKNKSSIKLMKIMAIVISILPGAFFYSIIVKFFGIPTGFLNLIIAIIFGYFYTSIIAKILIKPFRIIKEFLPLL